MEISALKKSTACRGSRVLAPALGLAGTSCVGWRVGLRNAATHPHSPSPAGFSGQEPEAWQGCWLEASCLIPLRDSINGPHVTLDTDWVLVCLN